LGKVLLVFLVVIGAALYFPPTRAKILEEARPLMTPAFIWMTNQELGRIVEDLGRPQGAREELPTRRGEFDAWLDRRYPQEESRIDSWGTRYRLEVFSSRFRAISAGPDSAFGTDDDLVREGARDTETRTR
jgi:hypothetical protein